MTIKELIRQLEQIDKEAPSNTDIMISIITNQISASAIPSTVKYHDADERFAKPYVEIK